MADHHQQLQQEKRDDSTSASFGGGGSNSYLHQRAGQRTAGTGQRPQMHRRDGAQQAPPSSRRQASKPPDLLQPRRSLRGNSHTSAVVEAVAAATGTGAASAALPADSSSSRTRRRGGDASLAAGLSTSTTTGPAPAGIVVTASRPTKKLRSLVTSFTLPSDEHHGPAPDESINYEADASSLEARKPYNLRASTVARSVASRAEAAEAAGHMMTATGAAVITPRTPAAPRLMDFVVKNSAAAAAAAAAAVAGSTVAEAATQQGYGTPESSGTILPPGVVNIYHRDKSSTRQSCTCPWNRCVVVDTSLGFSHIANYGEENGEVLREAEARQMATIQRLLPSGSADSPTVDTNSEFDGDDDDDGDDEDDDSMRTRAPSRNSRSAASNRRLNLQDTFGAAVGGVPQEAGVPVAPRDHPHPASRIMASEAMIRQPYLSPKMRSILIHWIVEVGQEYKVSDAAFHLSVSLLDQLLLKGPTKEELEERDERDDTRPDPWFLIQRSDFQAVGCACAWIASKLEDRNAPSVDDFVWIADYSFSCNRLRSLEEQVCRELEFRLSSVTPHHFVNIFLRASNACPNGSCEFDHPVLRQVVMYLLALSRLSYHLSLCKPSLLAAAAVYLARATVGIRECNPAHAVHPEGYWTRTLEYYTSYTKDDLRSAVLIIHRYQLVAESAENIKGLFTKFSKSSHHYASLKTAVRVEDLGFETTLTHDSMEFQAIAEEPI